MNKTFWIGFVVVFIVVQVVGFLVHGIWLDETYSSLSGTVFRPEPEINSTLWMMVVSSAVYVFLFCYIFTKGYEGKGIGEGLRYGLLMGLFVSVPMSLDNYVVYPVPVNLAVTWFVTGIVNFAIAGVVLAAIYKPTAPATAASAA